MAAVTCACIAIVLTACDERISDSGRRDADRLPVLSAVEDLRLGSLADPDSGFSRIGAVAVDQDGNVYVVEQQPPEIRVFDAAGTPLRTIGRQGQGPGEFVRPGLIGILLDTLWVNDPGLGRVTLFLLDGSVAETFPTAPIVRPAPPSPNVMVTLRGGVLRSDGFVHMERADAVAFLGPGTAPPDSLSVPIIRLDRDGNVVDTAGEGRIYLVHSDDEGSPGRPAQTDLVDSPGPPADTPLRVRTDAGSILIDRKVPATADGASFSITRLSTEGDTLYHRVLGYSPTPYTAAAIDSLRSTLGDITIPEYRTPVIAAHVGSDGTVLLLRDGETGADRRWLVIDSDGTPRGQAMLPASISIRWIGSDAIYAVERDSFDVPWLVRYRLN
ncbi:MAG: 6-bladed beta-propeller [Gemmatimonadota bacterium]